VFKYFGLTLIVCLFACILGFVSSVRKAKADDSTTVPVSPGNSIQSLVDQNPEGTHFTLKAGIYRLQQVRPKNGDTFTGENGAVLNGSELLAGFAFNGSAWVLNGQSRRAPQRGQCLPASPACSSSEDLFLDDVLLQPVSSVGSLAPGRWFFDYANSRIMMADNPTGHNVELSSAQSAFIGAASDVTIENLTIEKYACPAQLGAVHARSGDTPSSNWTIRDNLIRFNHGSGIRVGNGTKALRNRLLSNGQLGIGDIGNALLIDDNEIGWNNYAGFDPAWEGGGAKFLRSRGAIIRYNYSHDNNGTGLWTDTDNVNTLYEFNKVYNNSGPGIQHEISYEAEIRHNDVRHNGTGGDAWAWGSQILVQNSRGVQVHDNYVEVGSPVGNGIFLVQQNRGRGEFGAYFTVNNFIHHNEVVYLGSNGRSGAVADYAPATMFAGNNRFDSNGYRGPGQGLARWEWNGRLDWQGFQGQGQDVSGWFKVQP
jgi:hypothetical protein